MLPYTEGRQHTYTEPQAEKPKKVNSVFIRSKTLFSTVSLLALRPAQLPTQQGPGSHSDAVKQLASETNQSSPKCHAAPGITPQHLYKSLCDI